MKAKYLCTLVAGLVLSIGRMQIVHFYQYMSVQSSLENQRQLLDGKMFCLHLGLAPLHWRFWKHCPESGRWQLNQSQRSDVFWINAGGAEGSGAGFWGSDDRAVRLTVNFGKVSYSVVVHRQLACLFGTSDNRSPTPSQNAKVIHCPAHISLKGRLKPCWGCFTCLQRFTVPSPTAFCRAYYVTVSCADWSERWPIGTDTVWKTTGCAHQQCSVVSIVQGQTKLDIQSI